MLSEFFLFFSHGERVRGMEVVYTSYTYQPSFFLFGHPRTKHAAVADKHSTLRSYEF